MTHSMRIRKAPVAPARYSLHRILDGITADGYTNPWIRFVGKLHNRKQRKAWITGRASPWTWRNFQVA
jgi:hypothetical protein